MSVLFIENGVDDRDISLDIERFLNELEFLAKPHSFYYNQEDSQEIPLGDLVDVTIQPLLRNVILNMKYTLEICSDGVDANYINDLRIVENRNDELIERLDKNSVALNFSEAVFIDKYADEISDWIPLTFDMTILTCKNNVSNISSVDA